MIAAISGAGGFIGQTLTRKLRVKGGAIRIIDRERQCLSENIFSKEMIEGSDVIINLAGAPISKRWTRGYKNEILESRINTTKKIAAGIRTATLKPTIFISASATGIYASTGEHTESTGTFGNSFLTEVCRQWEEAALACNDLTRVVILRLGVVLGSGGGMLGGVEGLFRFGLGGKLGNGRQSFSFIHINDLVDAILFTIENSSIHGIVNAVSPFPTTNADFTDKMGKVMKQPAWISVPAFALKLWFGEAAQVFLEGQRVLPERLQEAGFRFRFPTLQNALMHIYR